MTFATNAASASSSSGDGDVVRPATGMPISLKNVAASKRQGPSVFKLLRALDFGEPIGVGTRRSAMAPDCACTSNTLPKLLAAPLHFGRAGIAGKSPAPGLQAKASIFIWDQCEQ